jgi:hypothetical protein
MMKSRRLVRAGHIAHDAHVRNASLTFVGKLERKWQAWVRG